MSDLDHLVPNCRRTVHSAEPAVDEKWIAQASRLQSTMICLKGCMSSPHEVWIGASMPATKQTKLVRVCFIVGKWRLDMLQKEEC